jgi:flagellar motor protein MotB
MPGNCDPPIETQFKPGQSGNPAGKPKGSKNFSTILKERVERESNILEDGRYLTRLEVIAEQTVALALASEKEETRLKATGEIIDRLEGKAKQSLEANIATTQVNRTDLDILRRNGFEVEDDE